MAVALVVAAGRGERLGSAGPKALAPLAGRPMLEWSVMALRRVPGVDAIVIALPADRLEAAPAGTHAVAGGSTRSQSVRAALRAAAPSADDEPVIVHDAARALVQPQIFTDALARLASSGADAVIAAAPVTDTIKRVGDQGDVVLETVDRSRLWAVQTPQVFRRRSLERALAAPEAQLDRATDDAWLVEQQGGTVVLLPTSPENFKITTPLDLRIAELILRERSGP
jgi:2-C-methyl-D-erythritol 4-phosphate cytidylyltransferase